MATRARFILSLFLIDIALLLVIIDSFPMSATIPGGGIMRFHDHERHVALLTPALIVATVGVYLIVESFYRWPANPEPHSLPEDTDCS